MDRCWILLGMMGAGKSSVGRALAEQSGRTFVDTDLLLQQRLGRSIRQIFQIYGEEAFRDHETNVLRSLEPGPCVVSTGGGIVQREANWQEMRRLGTTIYLEAPLDTLISRLGSSRKKRPLLEVSGWETRVKDILEHRRPLYERADLRIDVSGSEVDCMSRRILQLLGEEAAN